MKLLGQGVESAVAAQTDIFGRDAFAGGLLRLFSNSLDPLVVALDEKWGAGKTVFARRLAKRADQEGHTVVYFDSFKRDYDPDVFIALTAELLAKIPKEKQEKSFKENATAIGKIVGRTLFKGAIRAATAGAVKASDFDEAVAETANEIGDVAEAEFDKFIDERLSGAKKEEEAFSKFRQSLIALAEGTMAGDEQRKPIIFIIDELDRCRPDYALDVLETIKHFFSVPGVHFLLVCDFGQLVASVRARYGSATEGEIYLEKFVDVRVSFPLQEKSKRQSSVCNLVKDMPDDGADGKLWGIMSDFISNFLTRRDYSLRRIEKILTQFALCMAFTDSKQFRHSVVLAVLCDLKISNHGLFRKSKNGTLSYKQINEYYKFDDQSDTGIIRWLRYFYDADIDRSEEEWKSLNSSLWNWHLDKPEDTAIYLANEVVDRISA
jgi:KAP family P-loop domain